MRKAAFCICENKDTDQLRGDREADQRLCFRCTDSAIPLLPKYEFSSLQSSPIIVQPGLCGTWSETPEDRFSHNEAHIIPRYSRNTFLERASNKSNILIQQRSIFIFKRTKVLVRILEIENIRRRNFKER